MKKRPRLFVFMLALGMLIVVLAPIGITWFYFPTYRSIGLALTFFLSAGVELSAGIKHIRVAKSRGAPMAWWKNYLIIMALFWGCAGVLECLVWLNTTSKSFQSGLESPLASAVGFLFILLILGLGVYVMILSVQQLVASKRQRQSQESQQSNAGRE